MSSAKNYSLEVSPDEHNRVVTFTVKKHPSLFLTYVRTPLATVLLAFLVPKAVAGVSGAFEWKLWSFFQQPGWSSVLLHQFILWFIQGGYSQHVECIVTLLIGVIAAALLLLQEPSDSMVVMANLGVQLSSKSRWRFLNRRSNKEFIPLSNIIDLVIHEGFHGYGQVIFYMCILTKAKSNSSDEGNGVNVVFPNFLPRKDILIQVWRHSRKILYGDQRRHFRHIPGYGLKEVQHLHE